MRPWVLRLAWLQSAANPLSFPPRCAVASGRIRTPPPWQAIDGSRPRSVKPWIEPPRLSLTLHPLVEDVGRTGQRPGESVYLVTTKVSPARQATKASRRHIGPPLASLPSTCAHAARLRLSSPPSDVPQAGRPAEHVYGPALIRRPGSPSHKWIPHKAAFAKHSCRNGIPASVAKGDSAI